MRSGRAPSSRAAARGVGNKGYFFAPTVLADVPTIARAMNEEPFGPVALINAFNDLDEAVAEANRLPYGLASYAFTALGGDGRRARRSGSKPAWSAINQHAVCAGRKCRSAA